MEVQPGYRQSLTASKNQAPRTPARLLSLVGREFGPFDFDPCPSSTERQGDCPLDGLDPDVRWGKRNFVNPPYNSVGAWLQKAVDEAEEHDAESLFLIPARTWTAWFHDWVVPCASLVRFLRGVVAFGGYRTPLSTPLMLVLIETRAGRGRGLQWQRQEATLRRPIRRVKPVVETLEVAGLKTVEAVSEVFANQFGFELMRVAAGQLPPVPQLSTAPRL